MDDLDNLDDEPAPQPITRPARRRPEPPLLPSAAPDRRPPASQEAEEHVLAVCLLDEGATLQRAVQAGLTPESFYFPANRLIFETLATLTPPSLETLVAELQTRRQLDQVGGMAYLMGVTDTAPTTAHASYFIEKVRTLAILRDSIKAHTQAVEDAYSFTGDIDQFLQVSRARVEAIGTNAAVVRKQDQLKELLARRVQACNPPPEPVTRLFLADKPIATPGNLQTITAKSKTGKTVATGAAVAAIICATTSTLNRDTFKFRASNPQGHAVIVLDTEQSPYDAWTCYQRILKRADTEKDPPWLLHFALVGYSVAKRKQALATAMEYAKATFGGVFLVVLDGVAHFVTSINELEECNALADWLRELSVSYDTAMFCVIHSNEGDKAGDDSRGHLGKQLMRDAESNLLLRKAGEVTTVTSDKQRKAPITEADSVAFQWSDEQQMHVSCGAPEKKKAGGRTRAHTIQEFWDIIPAPGSSPMTGTALHRFASQIAEIKPNTFKDLLAEATKDGQLTRVYDPRTGFSYVRAV